MVEQGGSSVKTKICVIVTLLIAFTIIAVLGWLIKSNFQIFLS